ncbi:prophage tail fiber family protein, partial [Escherichia coli 3.4870]
SAC